MLVSGVWCFGCCSSFGSLLLARISIYRLLMLALVGCLVSLSAIDLVVAVRVFHGQQGISCVADVVCSCSAYARVCQGFLTSFFPVQVSWCSLSLLESDAVGLSCNSESGAELPVLSCCFSSRSSTGVAALWVLVLVGKTTESAFMFDCLFVPGGLVDSHILSVFRIIAREFSV